MRLEQQRWGKREPTSLALKMPLAQIAEPWPTMELVQLETEVMRLNCICLSPFLFFFFLWTLCLLQYVVDLRCARCPATSLSKSKEVSSWWNESMLTL